MSVFEQTSKKAASWLPCLLVPRSLAKLVLLCAVVSLSACDCENRVRKLLSDRDTPAVRKGETLDPKKRSSAPKEQEPNDSPAQATAMVLTSELRAITGQLQQSTDRDWIALSCKCKPGETWLLEVRVEPSSAESLTPIVDFELPGQSGSLSYKEVDESTGVLSIPIVAVTNKPVKFAVRAANGQGHYAIRFKRRLSGGVVEAEPNDYAARAWPVKMPGEVQGFFDRKGDRDILALDLQGLDRTKLYTVQVTSAEGGQMMVEWFLDEALKAQFLPPMLIDSGKVGEVPNIKLPAEAKTLWLAASAGAFYSRTKPYRIRLVAHPPAAAKTVMEWEPDGQGESLMSISQTTSIQGYMHVGDEQDQWMLSLPEVRAKSPMDDIEPGKSNSPSGTEVVLPKTSDDPTPSSDDESLTPRPAPIELKPWPKKTPPAYLVDVLYKAKSEKLMLSASVGQGDAAYKSGPPSQTGRAICRQPMAAGKYPITIKAHPQEGLAFDQRQYAALVRVHTPGIEDELEPNQTRQAADPLMPGKSKTGVIAEEGDVDYFVIDLPEAAKVANAFGQYLHKVKITLAKHPANLQLQVFDAQGISLGVSNKTGQGGAEVYAGQWQQGRYWVAVSSVRGHVCTPYRLTLQMQ